MSYLAKVTIYGLSEQELVYIRKELYDYNDRASEPIRYTVEYMNYDRDYLTDEIIEKLKEDD